MCVQYEKGAYVVWRMSLFAYILRNNKIIPIGPYR